jgi:hypothetical protein
LIREIKQDGYFGDIIALRPSKVEEALRKKPHRRGWCQGKANLAENALIRPFNFETNHGSSHLIPKSIWTTLKGLKEVRDGLINITDVRNIVTLKHKNHTSMH